MGLLKIIQKNIGPYLCFGAGRESSSVSSPLNIKGVKNIPFDRPQPFPTRGGYGRFINRDSSDSSALFIKDRNQPSPWQKKGGHLINSPHYASLSTRSSSSAASSVDTSTRSVSSSRHLLLARNCIQKSTANFVNSFKNCRNLGLKPAIENKFKSIWEQHKDKIQRMRPNAYGFKKIKCRNTAFFINKENKVLYRGVKVSGKSGASKLHKYGTLAEGQVGLVAIKGNFKRDAQKDNSDIENLNLETVFLNTVVDDKLMIAPHAGGNLKSKEVKVEAFYKAVDELSILHKNNIYLRDIKPSNLAFDEDKNQVNFIDVDGRVRIRAHQTEVDYRLWTANYITPDLIGGAYYRSTDSVEKQNFFRTADEYAFLLSMIETTTKNRSLQFLLSNLRVDIKNQKYLGVLNDGNQHLFEKWIRENIKREFRGDATALLRNPALLAQRYPDHACLSEMIK